MSLHVQIESWPGSAERANEDWAGHEANVIVVLDGAGIPKHLPTGCIHSVEWFVNRLGPAILRHARQSSNSLVSSLERAITDVRVLHEDRCDLTNPNAPSATVVILRTSNDVIEGLVLADSTLVIKKTSGDVIAITDNRLQQLKTQLTAGGRPPARGDAMSGYRNRPGGFWTAGTLPDAASQSLILAWPAETVTEAALLSDGATRLVDLFHQTEWPQLMDQLGAQGPASVLRAVRQAEDSDPNGERWRRSKVHDDATIAYVRRLRR
ncbi:integrase [Microlunatus elymi]|uniref:Integrase n=1 Tax=Microlunatus elymi TaxID=2596828 RepID=A0A516PV57_9ACTN|nr:protein phosphatase 2C domain-containing protein [Microlunatus elymi]QDP95078.1 integrase [Microlunatus elymi]